MGICTLLDRIDESMLDTDSSGIVSREISDKGFVSWGGCKRVFLTTSMSFLVFPSSPAALSFLASFAACLVNTTFHMLTTMAIDDIEVAVFNGAKTQTEQAEAAEQNARDEAKALRAAFAEYYGIDALSDAAAYQCIIDVRYEGGTESAKSKMERDTSALLAEALDEGEVTEARLSSLSHSGFANNLTISDAAFEDILNIAKENMKVSVPVYSVEGAVVGEYSFVRF